MWNKLSASARPRAMTLVARARLTLAALAAVTLVGVAVVGVWTFRRPMHTRE
jgi:hypothetical protein